MKESTRVLRPPSVDVFGFSQSFSCVLYFSSTYRIKRLFRECTCFLCWPPLLLSRRFVDFATPTTAFLSTGLYTEHCTYHFAGCLPFLIFFLFFLQENLIWFLFFLFFFILCGNDGSYVCNCRRPSPIHTIPEVVTLTFESRCTLFSRKPARWVASWNFRVNSTHARRCVYVRYASEYYIPTLHTKQNTLTNISLPRGNAFMNWWLCRSSRECKLSFLTSPCLHQCIYVGMKTIYVIYGNMVTLIYTSRDEKL